METSAKQEHTLQNPSSQLVSKDWSQQAVPNVLPSSPATLLQSPHLPPAPSLALGPQPKTVATPELLIGLLQQWQQSKDAREANCSRMGQRAASAPTVQHSHQFLQLRAGADVLGNAVSLHGGQLLPDSQGICGKQRIPGRTVDGDKRESLFTGKWHKGRRYNRRQRERRAAH